MKKRCSRGTVGCEILHSNCEILQNNPPRCDMPKNKYAKIMEEFDKEFNNKLGLSFECSDAEGIYNDFKNLLHQTIEKVVREMIGEAKIKPDNIIPADEVDSAVGHDKKRQELIDLAKSNWGIDFNN